VKATHVKDQVKPAADRFQAGDILHAKICLHGELLGVLFGQVNGAPHEVYARYLPARFCQGDHVGAGTATQVERPAGRVGVDKIEQLWRRDARIPDRLLQISQVKEQFPHHADYFTPDYLLKVEQCLLGKDQKWTLVKLKSGQLGEFLMESSKVDTWEFCCGESERMNHFILIPDTDLDGIRS
jgi:hypothetical protein